MNGLITACAGFPVETFLLCLSRRILLARAKPRAKRAENDDDREIEREKPKTMLVASLTGLNIEKALVGAQRHA